MNCVSFSRIFFCFNFAGSISRASGFNPETNSNAYATINKLPLVATASRRRSLLGLVTPMDHQERDYATLEKMSPRSPPGPIVPGVHSSTPLGGMYNFTLQK